jgi:hypothetical protein
LLNVKLVVHHVTNRLRRLNQNAKEVVTIYLRMRMSSIPLVHPKIICRKQGLEASLLSVYHVAKHSNT